MGIPTPWQDFETWQRYGIEKGYNERNPLSIFRSNKKSERSWYAKGGHGKWLSSFKFNKVFERVPWQSKKEWIQYGINKGYNERNPSSFYKSKDKTERSWYAKGTGETWLPEFEFNYYRPPKDLLEKFLRKNPQAKAIAELSEIEGFSSEALQILSKLWNNRFSNYKDITKGLRGVFPKITKALGNVELAKISNDIFKGPIYIHPGIKRDLINMLTKIGIQQYQKDFNISPLETIAFLSDLVNKQENFHSYTILRNVENYYKEVMNFDIPGYGRLSEVL